MLSDADLDALSQAVEQQKAAEAELGKGSTPRRLAEASYARARVEAMNAALLPSILAEIRELRRLIRIYAPEQIP